MIPKIRVQCRRSLHCTLIFGFLTFIIIKCMGRSIASPHNFLGLEPAIRLGCRGLLRLEVIHPAVPSTATSEIGTEPARAHPVEAVTRLFQDQVGLSLRDDARAYG
jgi:hypothetical protein